MNTCLLILSLTTQSALEWNPALRTPALHGSTPWCPYQRPSFDCFFKIWRGGEGVSTHNSRALSLSNSFLRARLGWILNLAGTTAIKESTTEMREVRVCWQHEKRKIINLNYFLFLLWWLLVFHSCSVEVNRCTISRNFPALRLFLHGTSFLLSKLLQAMLCDRSGIFKHPNDSLQWRTPFFSYIKCFLWNNVKSRRVLLASVKRNTK